MTMNQSVSASASVSILEHIGCMYLPADNGRNIYDWYEKHFTQWGHTRHYKLFYNLTPVKGSNINFLTEEWLPGQIYEMFSVRFETDCIEELYNQLIQSGEVRLEPLRNYDDGPAFCFYDPQGNKFQVWQDPKTTPQPLRTGVRPLIRVSAFFFPASDPEAAKRWYADVLGVKIGESGQPVTESGVEFYFLRPFEEGKTINFVGPASGTSDLITNVSIVNLAIRSGLEELHQRMVDTNQDVQPYIFDREGCGRYFLLAGPDGNKLEIWEFQTVCEQRKEHVDSADWKERFNFLNFEFHVQIDEFLEIIRNDIHGTIKTFNIKNYEEILETDPEGLEQLLNTLREFGRQYPEKAFHIMYRKDNEFIKLG